MTDSSPESIWDRVHRSRRSRIANYGNLTLDRHQCRIFFHISDAEFQHEGFRAWPSTSQKLSGMMTHVSRSLQNWKNIKSEENNANLVTHPSWKFVFLWEFSRLCYKFDHLQSSYRVSISTWWGLIIRAHDFKLVGIFVGWEKSILAQNGTILRQITAFPAPDGK